MSSDSIRQHLLIALDRYWPGDRSSVLSLPVVRIAYPEVVVPLRLVLVRLPEWAEDVGVEGCIAVPQQACQSQKDPCWETTDWWLAAFLMLECAHERAWEMARGPIHSYGFRLRGWDKRIWERAWVNRIALFFRRWAARQSDGVTADKLFGPVPEAEFVLTHDVDAIGKTVVVRVKQGAFNVLNAFRSLAKGDFPKAGTYLRKAGRMCFSHEDWWKCEHLVRQEKESGIRSHFNFYAGRNGLSLKSWLLDPSYAISDRRLSTFIRSIKEDGWTIGLHPSFDSWQDSGRLREQKHRLEAVAETEAYSCRQHWLRFSWGDTWESQEMAGLRLDTTLMFNDRPGFRSAAAVKWHPWNFGRGQAHDIMALPTVLMDSHLYDYQLLAEEERERQIAYWVNEVREVGGVAGLLWHFHTLTEDYGWTAGFDRLLHMIASSGMHSC